MVRQFVCCVGIGSLALMLFALGERLRDGSELALVRI